MKSELSIFQAENGALELRTDRGNDPFGLILSRYLPFLVGINL